MLKRVSYEETLQYRYTNITNAVTYELRQVMNGYRNRGRQGFKRWNNTKAPYVPILEIGLSEEFRICGCWLSKFKYPRIKDESLHIKFAQGTGDIVRHLCSCSRCFNPLHVVKGTDRENVKDETDADLFAIAMMRQVITEDFSDLGTNEEFLLLQAQITRVWGKSAVEVNQYFREEFRKYNEKRLAIVCKENVSFLQDKMLETLKMGAMPKENRP